MNLLKLELMSATEKIVEALKMRGLFVKAVEGVIEFSNCMSKNDFSDVQILLNKLDIPFWVHGDNRIEILVNELSIITMKKIVKFGGSPFHLDYSEHHSNWRFFTSRSFGLRIDAFKLEYNMARFVKVANYAGIAIFAGCNGHLKKSPRFQFSGPFMGAWFTVIQQKYLSNVELNYEWNVVYEGYTGSELRAVPKGEWCLNKIHEDTLKMAEILEIHADDIRKIKKESFYKNQKEIVNVYINRGEFEDLEHWMFIKSGGDGVEYNDKRIIRTGASMAR